MLTSSLNRSLLLATLLLFSATMYGQDESSIDIPSLSKPKVGSLVGEVGLQNPESLGIATGNFQAKLDWLIPNKRGMIGIDIIPRYSLNGGQSEFGLGWNWRLSLKRESLNGTVNFDGSDLISSPWGLLQRNRDGQYYTQSSEGLIRVEINNDNARAFHPSGKTYVFVKDIESSFGVYSWRLETVEDALGSLTYFTYERNDSGRSFVKQIAYGGRGSNFQYRISFEYQTFDSPLFRSWTSGKMITLDRLVKKVIFKTRRANTFITRYSYTLGYDSQDANLGQYLVTNQKVFKSGASFPAVTYSYGNDFSSPDSHTVVDLDHFKSLMDSNDNPVGDNKTVYFDYNRDGLLDVYSQRNRVWYLQTGAGFQNQAPIPLADDSDAFQTDCVTGTPHLARLAGPKSEILSLMTSPGEIGTRITVCALDGRVIYEKDFPFNSRDNKKVRIADLNGDMKDDIIAVDTGVTILQNLSDENSINFVMQEQDFSAEDVGEDEAFHMRRIIQVSINDINGDGLRDIVGIEEYGVRVFYNRGKLQFDETSEFVPFFKSNGRSDFRNRDYAPAFGDINRDGLSDIIFFDSRFVWVLMNREGQFVEQNYNFFDDVEGLRPYLTDFNNTGMQQISFDQGRDGMLNVALNSISSGLLSTIDNGRGTIVRVKYKRSPAAVGLGKGLVQVATLERQQVGYGSKVWHVSFNDPQLSQDHRRILGYRNVNLRNQSRVVESKYQFDDILAARMEEKRVSDPKFPSWEKVNITAYETAEFDDIFFYRQKSSNLQWYYNGSAIGRSDGREVLAYENLFCPVKEKLTNEAGTATISKIMFQNSSWDAFAHCLTKSVTETSDHETFGFTSQTTLERNNFGQVKHIQRKENGSDVTVTRVFYDELGLIEKIEKPGIGEQTFDFDGESFLLGQTIDPTGIVIKAKFDETTDNIIALRTNRSTQGANWWTEEFSFDDFERLESNWDNFTSKEKPEHTYSYILPNGRHFGQIETQTLNAKGSYQLSRNIIGADDKTLGQVNFWDDNWIGTELMRYTAASQKTEIAAQKRFSVLNSLTANDFFANTEIVTTEIASSIVKFKEQNTKHQTALTETTSYTIKADNGVRRLVATTNGEFQESWILASDDRKLAYRNAEGHVWRYVWDAKKRLRSVILPSGASRMVKFDDAGRKIESFATGIGGVSYSYDKGNELVKTKKLLDKTKNPTLAIVNNYRPDGRLDVVNHRTDSQILENYRYYYDGSLADRQITGQKGFLSGITSSKFAIEYTFRRDGLIKSEGQTVRSKHKVSTVKDYYPNKMIKERQLTISGITNPQDYTLSYEYDQSNRISKILLDGREIVSVTYDVLGRIDRIQYTENNYLEYEFDTETKRPSGYSLRGTNATNYSWELDNRGHIVEESFNSRQRTYQYDARNYLETKAGSPDLYDYDEDGRRVVSRSQQELEYDSSGRVKKIGPLKLKYGAHGRLVTAEKGGTSQEYYYDGTGLLIATEGPHGLTSYFQDIVITDDNTFDPVIIAGKLVGIIVSGDFKSVFSDLRDSVLADAEGNKSWADPFGTRDQSISYSEALSFIKKGEDKFTGFINTGHRFYVPQLGEFSTPDPLYLKDITQCLENSVSCNLYSYGNNDPLGFRDPSGLDGDALFKGYATAAWTDLSHYIEHQAAATKQYINGLLDSTLTGMGLKPSIPAGVCKVGGRFGYDNETGLEAFGEVSIKKGYGNAVGQFGYSNGGMRLVGRAEGGWQYSKGALTGGTSNDFRMKVGIPEYLELEYNSDYRARLNIGGTYKKVNVMVYFNYRLSDESYEHFDKAQLEQEWSYKGMPYGGAAW